MKSAMILAAGRGERLRPLTDTCPKALCAINGVPLIEYHVLKLCAAGFNPIVINHAHLGGQIRQYLGNGARFGVDIEYAPEPPGGLETGGGLYNALPLLGEAPFLAVNADIFTDFDFASLTLNTAKLATLVLVDNPAFKICGDFGLTSQGLVLNNNKDYTYSGIAYYHPSIFNALQPGRYSIIPILRHLINQQKVSGILFQGQWDDVGTSQRLQALNN